ncbi:CRP-like cAMP-binding protein [Methylobacterium sp. BE186]|uniref:Crp/Fnr family transcriptional regulator n=1 Tax=Methylobacterium sp. BE186 TaxID=2817715 RepID=UPI00285A164B|nr:Crp/Fnr family transcriptional regulator [Methylobacterium sp. BE186]MDR7037888.1 CRP-like cAMP-binding protein [Methylobacterium sp. BE186]
MSELLVRKLRGFDALDEAEVRILRDIARQARSVEARADIVEQGSRPGHSTLILEGLTGRYRILADGRRQITSIDVPGDFVDLHSFTLKTMDHGVAALSPCRVAITPHGELQRITETQPHLTRLLWLTTVIDAAIHREWLVGIGRMSALERFAHLICELYSRLGAVGLVDAEARSFTLPVTQSDVADMLGLTNVHVNRTLQELRRRGLLTWRGRTVTIPDWAGLTDVARFDPIYLHQHQEPR